MSVTILVHSLILPPMDVNYVQLVNTLMRELDVQHVHQVRFQVVLVLLLVFSVRLVLNQMLIVQYVNYVQMEHSQVMVKYVSVVQQINIQQQELFHVTLVHVENK